MEENSRWAFLKSPRTGPVLLALALLLSAGLGGHYLLNVKPEFELTLLRAQAQQDLLSLFHLQLAHHKRYAVFSSDLEQLLRGAPDGGAALRARLQKHTHLDTLVVAGDAGAFKLEANVRDPERTLLVMKGPRPGDPKQP